MNDANAYLDAAYRRHHCCNSCGQRWSMKNAPSQELPPSAQDAVFADMRYNYCAACGNLKMRRKGKK